VAQLVREQRAQARERERIEQELRVARLIQHTLLPKGEPALTGWQLSAHYEPAREVGGDFYDFLLFEDGRLGIVIGDVTDKGVPAALVMATTRSILRSVAQGTVTPGKVLERANDLLYPDIPPKMFVTCLYAILDPHSGRLWYANAGHDLPYRRHGDTVSELRATGMPLGLMPGMSYEEKEVTLLPGERVLFYSDGLVEAHNPAREMFGFPRLMALLKEHLDDTSLSDFLLDQLKAFTGADWEQEDDVTLVTLTRSGGYGISTIATRSAEISDGAKENDMWRTLAELSIPSEPGNERLAMEQVGEAVQVLKLPAKRLAELKTAVAEATMNAMEHGNGYESDRPVIIQVLTSPDKLAVRITDLGGNQSIPTDPETPDLEAKLAQLQAPRGWGLFLIKNLVDEMHVESDATHHTVELIVYLEGASHASKES
jgi:anti-sigma regulatory factor (Ser/Thr protein kinase)